MDSLPPQSPHFKKPLLRGHFHQGAFFLFLGACCFLIVERFHSPIFIGDLIYSLSVCGMFAVSALYHRIHWGLNARMWMRRLDHGAIFILIAGSGTPIFLSVFAPEKSYFILTLTWAAAVVGILQTLFWVRAPKWVSVLLYSAAGWIVLPYLGDLYEAIGSARAGLIVLSGLTYTAGGVIYALKKPNPSARVFGYHEIFHLLLVMGAILHFIVVASLR